MRLRRLNAKLLPSRTFLPPEVLVLGVNNLCNLHCKMCDVGTQFEGSNFYANLMASRPLNMPLELIQRVMSQAADFCPHAILGYAFTEPLIYPHLIESLEYAQSLRLRTSITTNAMLLPQKAHALCAAGLGELFISLDGPEEIHNEIRGNKQSFERAVSGIDRLLTQPNPPKVSVFCTITEWNIGHLTEMATYFQAYPLQQLGFMHTNFTPSSVAELHNKIYAESYPATESNMDGINIQNMDLEALGEDLLRLQELETQFPLTVSPPLRGKAALEQFYLRPEEKIGTLCNDAFRTLMIKSDGTVIPAHGRCFNATVGNLYESPLADLWNSKELSDFRRTLMNAGGLLPACSRCCSAF